MKVYFGEDGSIRLTDPEVYKNSSELSNGCEEFVEGLKQMDQTMTIFLKYFEDYSKEVDKMKLQALGTQNLVEMEKENRILKEKELKSNITLVEKNIDRLTEELDSLCRMSTEQEALNQKHVKVQQ